MNDLAERLYRSYAFGEELDDAWSEAVLRISRERRIPLDRVIEELAKDAEAMMSFTAARRETAGELREAA